MVGDHMGILCAVIFYFILVFQFNMDDVMNDGWIEGWMMDDHSSCDHVIMCGCMHACMHFASSHFMWIIAFAKLKFTWPRWRAMHAMHAMHVHHEIMWWKCILHHHISCGSLHSPDRDRTPNWDLHDDDDAAWHHASSLLLLLIFRGEWLSDSSYSISNQFLIS